MIRALHSIRHDGVQYAKGALIEGLTAKAAQRLVDIKAAEFVITPEEELKKQKVQVPPPAISAEKYEEYVTALKDLYNAEELKKAAKEVGVDLTGISRRDDVIEAIITQGKADELVEDDEDQDDDLSVNNGDSEYQQAGEDNE